ncbi:MAG: flagella basal body P-ring formation protein FlgA [Rhodospirillales bacterium 69-11]|nr:MAG: flagella basal body P-ring formation protein FlgA [Rhodospirillales bacterium 69-11]
MTAMRALFLLPLLLAAAGADAATLRPATTLHGPLVLLRDLFDDAGPNAGRVLGPGPAPGGRIVVEAPQLAAIARQFGVAWRPVSKGDRAVLEWPGRPLPRQEVVAAVRLALVASGAAEDCLIELPGFNPPLVPLEAAPRADVTQLDYESGTGRFTAVLSVLAPGMEPVNTRVSGRVEDTIELPVTTTRLNAGTVLRPEDVHLARIPATLARGEVVHDVADAVGMQIKRSVAAGQPLTTADLARPVTVVRGATVQMRLQSPGLELTGQGVAMEAGATGERIRVLNPTSRAVLEAEVLGPNLVRIAPNAPVRLARGAGAGVRVP